MVSKTEPSITKQLRPARFIPCGALFLLVGLGACGDRKVAGPGFELVPLPFTHDSGAKGEFLLPEIMGSGAALLDYDGDGDLDVFLVQGHPGAGPNQLLRNDGGQFVNVTAAAGLAGSSGYGMGTATADFDNDGQTDLLVTAFGANRLYRNTGGKFEDVTTLSPSMAMPNGWSTSASFFDYDNDGWQDLVILSYIDYQIAANKKCQAPTGEPDYCTPRVYKSVPSHLFHNEKGRFVEVTQAAGLDRAAGPGLGVVALDTNGDGYSDLFVANDSTANHLWVNQKNGTFTEEALQRGVAYAENGLARAGMGVAPGDFDGDGDQDLIVLNLMREGATLFRNNGNGDFTDVSMPTGIHALTFQFTGFGVGWLDADQDGRLDLFLANGAVTRREEQRGKPQPYQERNLLIRQGKERFENAAVASLEKPGVYRGAAFGDIDNDGDVDVVVNANNGSAILLKNSSRPEGWLGVSARPGTRVEVKSAGMPTQVRWTRTDSSYLSASDSRVVFAVGDGVERLTVQEPGKAARSYSGKQVGLSRYLSVGPDGIVPAR